MSKKIHSALESIARRDVSDDTNLWPQIAARIEQKDHGMNPKFKFAWTVVLALLALALATTAAYAVYRYFSDPGMKSVGEAGMIQDVNATSQPTVLPPGATPGPMTVSGETHTINGVTIKLDWVFAQSFDQAFHVSASGLAPDMRFGIPTVTYSGGPQENQNSGTIFSSNVEGDQTTGIYLVRQMMARERVDIVLDVPVLKQQTPIASFHFEIKNMPVYRSVGRDKSVYAFETGNAALTLKWLNMTPNYTIAHLCHEGDKNWAVGKASIQYGSAQDHSDAREVSATDLGRTLAEGNGSCIELGFQLANSANIRWLVLVVDDLTIAPDEKHSGPWHFEEDVPSLGWLSSQLQIQDLPTAAAPQATVIPDITPVSQTEGAYTATLLSAYADANRMVFTVHLDGWKNYSTDKGFYYDFGLTDPARNDMEIPSSGSNPDPNSHNMTFQFSPVTSLKNERLTGKLNLNIQEDTTNNSPIQTFHFDIDLPVYKSTVLTPKQNISVNGISMWLERVEISPSYSKFDLCYAKPTVGYWSITSPTLQAGTELVNADNTTTMILLDTDLGETLSDAFGDLGTQGQTIQKDHQIEAPTGVNHARCEQIGFPVGSQDQPKTLTLTIPELDFSPDDISDADLKAAQEKLKPQGMEFTYDVISVHGNGFGGGGRKFVVQKKPAGMSDDDVFHAFFDALGYYHTGPWVFTLDTQTGATVTATPAPLASQQNNNLTATLLSNYADQDRVVFTLRLDGLNGSKYTPEMGSLTLPSGWVYNEQPFASDADPNVYTIQFKSLTHDKLGKTLQGALDIFLTDDAAPNPSRIQFHFDINLLVYSGTVVLEPKQSATAQGTEIWLERVEMSPSYTKVYLCYKKPYQAHWSLGPGTLQVDDAAPLDSSGERGVFFDDDFGGAQPHGPAVTLDMSMKGGACEIMQFTVGYQSQPKRLTLTLPEMSESIPGGLTDAIVKAAQEKLEPQGILFHISTDGSWIYDKRPDGMSDDEVGALVYTALGYSHKGPWVFTIDVKP